MKRRLLSIIFAICLAVSLIPARALAEEGETVAETENVVETVECLEEEHPEDAADEKEGTETIVLENTDEPSVEETVIAEDEEISAEAEAVEETAVAGTVLNALSDNEEEEIGTEEILSEETSENAVAVIGEEKYETLNEAVVAAADGVYTEIKLLKNAVGGIKVPAGKNIDLNLNGFEIDVQQAVGSTGTEANGLQLLKGSTITIRNGVIKASTSSVKIMIKNYANLTLDNVDIRGSVNNCGQLVVGGANTRIAADSGWAVCTGNYAKGDVITTVINDGNITSVAIETPLWETGGATVNESVTSTINGGTIGRIGTYDWRAEYGGSYLNAPLLENWEFIVNGGSIGIVDFAAKVGNAYYSAFADAMDKANSGQTVELLKDADLGGNILTLDKAITIDGGNAKHSITSTALNVIRVLSAGGSLAGTVKLANLRINATNSGMNGRAIGLGSASPIAGLDLVIENCEIRTTQRGITVNPDNNSGISLTVSNSTISLTNGLTNYNEQVHATSNYNNSRGISLWQMGSSTVNIINSTVQGFYYDINNAGGVADAMKVTITGSSLKGRAGINDHTSGTTWTLNNSQVHGINNFGGSQEAFANLVFTGDNNTVSITDCAFTTFFNENGRNNPNALQSLVSDRGTGNSIDVYGNTTYQIYDLSKGGTDYNPTAFAKKYECVDAGLGNGTYRILIHKTVFVEEVAPTCVDEGMKAHYECASCGRLYIDEAGTEEYLVDAKDLLIPISEIHTPGDWKVEVAPTCARKGAEVLLCKHCEKVLDTREVKATGLHTAGDWTTEKNATCTEDGLEERFCIHCGKVLESRVIKALGHKHNDEGVCSICGHLDIAKTEEPETSVTPEPAPNAKPTEADTSVVEVEVKEEIVEIVKNEVVVNEGEAEIKEEVITSIVESTMEGEAIVLPVASKEEEVNTVVLPEETLEAIATKEADVIIQLSDATIKLDSEAIAAVKEQAEGKKIEIRAIKIETANLSDTQKSAISDLDTVVIVTAQIFADGKYIGNFNGGRATIVLPLEIEEGRSPEDYKIYYVAEDGNLELVAAEYVNDHMVFTTGHFSDYAIVYEASAPVSSDAMASPAAPAEETASFPIIPAVVVAVVVLCGIAQVMKKKQTA